MRLKSKIKLFIVSIVGLAFIFLIPDVFPDSKTDIYSKLKCCPCHAPSIASCSCAKAENLKGYIDALLDEGLSQEEILVKVAKKYSLNVIIDKETKEKIEAKLIEEAPQRRPRINIEPQSYNLGTVSKSEGKIELKVEVQNKGNDALTITDLKTSCACTTVKLKTKAGISPAFGVKGSGSNWKVSLAPGEKAELIVVTDLNHPHIKLGHLLRTVKIISNDPVYPETAISIEAEIKG